MKYFDLMERMDQLIRFENTGDSNEFSEKLGISRRQLYYFVEELKVLGLPLSYDRKLKTFYYEKDCMLKIEISIKELGDSELRNYGGGKIFGKNFFLQNPCTIVT
jgi:hypothetical protein